jgi:hypothetical protein
MTAKLSVSQIKDAIKGTGGNMSAIAARLEVDWHTADKRIKESPVLVQALQNEKHKVTDKAKYNVVKAINDGDLQTSKWWLQVMDEDFKPGVNINQSGELVIRWVDGED